MPSSYTIVSIKSTIGIAATDINDATNANNSMDTTIGEITQSLGSVAGSFASLRAYQNVASTLSRIEMTDSDVI